MNTRRGSRTSVTCVAVIITLLLAACSSQKPEIAASTTPPTASPVPSATSANPTAPAYDITRNAPVGYDEWLISGSTDTDPAMQRAAGHYGLPGIYTGKGSYGKAPYVGISQLEAYCVIAFTDVQLLDNGDVLQGMVVLSRFNPDLSIVERSVNVRSMKARLDSYRPMCRGEAPVPANQKPAKVTAA